MNKKFAKRNLLSSPSAALNRLLSAFAGAVEASWWAAWAAHAQRKSVHTLMDTGSIVQGCKGHSTGNGHVMRVAVECRAQSAAWSAGCSRPSGLFLGRLDLMAWPK